MLTPLEFAERPRTMLDLFSGLGGASQAMVDRGWKVVRVDLDPRFKPTIIADVRQFHLNWSPDLLWASPPCTEFAKLTMPKSWHPSRQDTSDISLVDSTFSIIAAVRPRFWILENV